MKAKIFTIILTLFLLTLSAGCFADGEEKNPGKTSEKISAEEKPDPIEEKLQSMTLTEKVGQMVMIGVYGTSVNKDTQFLLSQYHFGGIIFYDRNMTDKVQVKNFVAELNAKSEEKVPLFVAVDEEGGKVARMKHELPVQPSQEEIGKTGDPSKARTYAKMTAKNLKEIGVNLNFAPVADVGSKDTRSFADNPQIVSEFVENAVAGYGEENFYCCLKHFPGIGAAKVDPHVEISSINIPREELEKYDLPPFRDAIKKFDNSKFMIMISHLSYDALDPDRSASLSKAVMTDLLRNDLGFTGVIITDDLDMGATAKHNDPTRMGVAAVKAGADIALVCHETDNQQKIYLGILDAVKSGEIPEERINESVRRILKMKLAM